MKLSELSHQELYEELEKVIRHWQVLDAEWQRRWRAVQALAQAKRGEIGAGAVSVDKDSYGLGSVPSLPFAQLMPDEPSISPDPPSGFDSGGGETGGAGANGEW